MATIDLSFEELDCIIFGLEKAMKYWDKQFMKVLQKDTEIAQMCNEQANNYQAVHRKIQPIYERLYRERCENADLLPRAIAYFGTERQCICTIEELAELQKELTKQLKNEGDPDHVAEEIADCEIMITQIKQIFELEEKVANYRKIKLQRLRNWLDKGYRRHD